MRRLFVCWIFIVALGLGLTATRAHATPVNISVNSTVDAPDANIGDGICATAGGACTLRAAIEEADAQPGPTTIVLPAGVYTLTLGTLTISSDQTVRGAGPTYSIVDGNGLNRVFNVAASANVTFLGITIRNGHVAGGPSSAGGGGLSTSAGTTVVLTASIVTSNSVTSDANVYGAGIFAGGRLFVFSSVISNNTAVAGESYGGGLFTSGDAVNIDGSRVTSNSVTSNDASGGGMFIDHGSVVTITRTTIDGNVATGSQAGGGGIFETGSSVQLSGVTISNNTAGSGGGGLNDHGGTISLINSTLSRNNVLTGPGAGIYHFNGGLTIINSTINNYPASGGASIYNDVNGPITLKNSIVTYSGGGGTCFGAIISNGHNLENGNACGFTAAGDITNTDPLIGPLQNNGGATQTHALPAGSPAIDAGDDSGCPATDQRGIARPQGAHCDIGSFEVVDNSSTPTPTPTPTNTAAATATATSTVTVTATPTPTNTAAATATATSTVTVTSTPTATPTGTSAPSDSWVTLPLTNAPSARDYPVKVWTGSEMLVWGGAVGSGYGPYTNTGGRYNPSLRQWTPITTTGAPAARIGIKAVWTGSEMLVWGGYFYNGSSWANFNDGAAYHPASDTWRPITSTNAPSGRGDFPAVWTGSEMIVWGGEIGQGGSDLADGARYNPSTDTWTPMSSVNAPSARWDHSAVWDGNEVIFWGGATTPGFTTNTGARYIPASDTWIPVTTTNAPSPRINQLAIWTGSEMILWGGRGPGSNGSDTFSNTGGRYSPATDSWVALPTANAPLPASQGFSVIWTGSEVIAWGGEVNYGSQTNTGARYNPANDSWVQLPTANAPSARQTHAAVWTGSGMIIWGGGPEGVALNDGATYYPPTSGATPTPTATATATATATVTTTVTATPTSTPTPTATSTPTASATPTSTAVITGTAVWIDPPSATAVLGMPVTVSVSISNVSNLGSFQFTIAYSAALVSLEDVTLGDFPGGTGRTFIQTGPTISNTTGSATFGAFSLGASPAGASGSGSIAQVRLLAHGVGSSPLHLQAAQISDISGSPVTVALLDGSLTVPCPGDFNNDGVIDILDIQQVAFRWGSQIGDLLYDARYDIQPPGYPNGNIDILDVQSVAYRWNTRCSDITSAAPAKRAAAPQQAANLTVMPVSRTVWADSVFTESILIDHAEELGGYQVTLGYDPEHVSVVGASIGPFPTSTGRTFIATSPLTPSSGTYEFGAFSLGATPAGPTGGGTLAYVQMRALDGGESPVTIITATLGRPDGSPQAAGALSGGEVNIFLPPPPVTTTVAPTSTTLLTSTSSGPTTTLLFPAGLVSQPVTITFALTDTSAISTGLGVLGFGFTLDAQDGAGQPVTQFSQTFTITLQYTDADVAGLAPDSLSLYYLSRITGQWVIVPTIVDRQRHTLTATLNHLTRFSAQGKVLLRNYLPFVER